MKLFPKITRNFLKNLSRTPKKASKRLEISHFRQFVYFCASLCAIFALSASQFSAVSALSPAGTFASENASILASCDKDSMSGQQKVFCLLGIVVNVLSGGVLALAILGVIIVGIQYMTASGDVGKAQAAKRRLYEIIIGIVAYFAIYAILRLLIPNFDDTTGVLFQTFLK